MLTARFLRGWRWKSVGCGSFKLDRFGLHLFVDAGDLAVDLGLEHAQLAQDGVQLVVLRLLEVDQGAPVLFIRPGVVVLLLLPLHDGRDRRRRRFLKGVARSLGRLFQR